MLQLTDKSRVMPQAFDHVQLHRYPDTERAALLMAINLVRCKPGLHSYKGKTHTSFASVLDFVTLD